MSTTRREELIASSLYNAIDDNEFRYLQILLRDRDANPNYVLADFGISPLHLAIGKHSKSFALNATKTLLKYGGNPNVRSVDGITPVHIAAAWGRIQILELLLQSGGDPWLVDDELKNAFDYASDEHHWNTVRLLEQFHRLDIAKLDDWSDLCDPEPKFRLTRDKVTFYNREVAIQYQAGAAKSTNPCKSVGTQTAFLYSSKHPEFTSNCHHELNHPAVFDRPKNCRDEPTRPSAFQYPKESVDVSCQVGNSQSYHNRDVRCADIGVQARMQVHKHNSPKRIQTARAAIVSKSSECIETAPDTIGGKYDFLLSDLRNNIVNGVSLNKVNGKSFIKRNLLTRIIGRRRGKQESLIDELKERQAAGLRGRCQQMSEVIPTTQLVEDEVMVEVNPLYEVVPTGVSPDEMSVAQVQQDITHVLPHTFEGEVSVHVNPEPCDSSGSQEHCVPTVPSGKVADLSILSDNLMSLTDEYKSELFLLNVPPVTLETVQHEPEVSYVFQRDLPSSVMSEEPLVSVEAEIKSMIHSNVLGESIISVEPGVNVDIPEGSEADSEAVPCSLLAKTLNTSELVALEEEHEALQSDRLDQSLTPSEPILNCDTTENREAFYRDLLASSTTFEPFVNANCNEQEEKTKHPVAGEIMLNRNATEESELFFGLATGLIVEKESDELSQKQQLCDPLIELANIAEIQDCTSSSDDVQIVYEKINDTTETSFASSPMYHSCIDHSASASHNDTKDLFDDQSAELNVLLTETSELICDSNDSNSEINGVKTKLIKKSSLSESQPCQFSELVKPSPPKETEDSFTGASEDYIYSDPEESVVLLERRFLVPQSQANSSGSSGPSDRSSSDTSVAYDTDTLIEDLKKQGFMPGQIIPATKKVYIKKLQRLARDTSPLPSNRPAFSSELERTLRVENWHENLPSYASLEREVALQFSIPDQTRRWREGLLKSSFCYLLLDPRVTCNLPCRADSTSPSMVWSSFLEAIFYVGKGKQSRPYSHLYQAVAVLKSGAHTSPYPKIQQILDIWKGGLGVVCLHVFQNVIPVEAYTREAAMIDALTLCNVRNACAGKYYGVAATWPTHVQKKLGVYLLYQALGIFVHEGERQLRPADIA